MGNLSILRGALPSAQVSTYTTGSITLPSAGTAFTRPKQFVSIASISPSGSGSQTFSAIPQTYSSLQLRIYGFIPSGGLYDSFTVQFNGDTGANYNTRFFYGSNGTSGVSASIGSTYIRASGGVYGSANTSYPTAAILDILDYASTTKYKTVSGFNGWDHNSNAESEVNIRNGLWRNTAAITSMTITTSNAVGAGTSYALYGIEG